MSDDLNTQLPIQDLVCDHCRSKRGKTLHDPAMYMRGHFLKQSNAESGTPMVEIQVYKFVRQYDETTGSYRVSAILNLMCPSCHGLHTRVRDIANLPAQIIHETVNCPNCGSEGSIQIQRLNLEEVNEYTDRLHFEAVLTCSECKNKQPFLTNLLINLRLLLSFFKSNGFLEGERYPQFQMMNKKQELKDDVPENSEPFGTQGSRDEVSKTQVTDSFDYDVVLSYAGEDRTYVEEVVTLLQAKGIRFFYDKFEKVELWGKDLYTHLDGIYRHRAKFCLMFISEHYAQKLWTNHERQSAQARAFQENQEYILPCRFDDTEIPGIKPTLGYVDLRLIPPKALADMVIAKLSSLNS